MRTNTKVGQKNTNWDKRFYEPSLVLERLLRSPYIISNKKCFYLKYLFEGEPKVSTILQLQDDMWIRNNNVNRKLILDNESWYTNYPQAVLEINGLSITNNFLFEADQICNE